MVTLSINMSSERRQTVFTAFFFIISAHIGGGGGVYHIEERPLVRTIFMCQLMYSLKRLSLVITADEKGCRDLMILGFVWMAELKGPYRSRSILKLPKCECCHHN